ncbi:hypothetical protein SEMRO_3158_G344590.1 [Seminavis robusta]|uniref:Uncharacterized protein n=1 Tax=Seminavis robusta TaxID=568900 RepID=A0A9N8HZV0_9STRA|nr:hypothetical protein SEMRO_3158_G344590.1 [Seminavis robusta]|eukprot:Sro3158_g344590.1 n/a (100) ;mRNA; r:3486-3785
MMLRRGWPHYLEAEEDGQGWENEHGFASHYIVWLSSGATEADIETMVSANGKKLTISEKWHQDLLDIGEFYYLINNTQGKLEDTNVRRQCHAADVSVHP